MRNRKGSTTVEFAVVAPIFFLLVFGMFEFGRVVMVQHLMTNAAREGARVAVLDGSTLAEVQKRVNEYTPTIAPTVVCSPAPGSAGYGELQTVTLTLPAGKVSWLTPIFYKVGITASATMRRETVQ